LGRIRLVGDVSGKEYQIVESTSGELKVRNQSDGVDILKADSTTVTDAGGVKLGSHASRHAYGGADAIGSNALRIAQVGLVLGTGSSVTVGAGGTYVIPKGVYYIFLGANTSLEVYDDVAGSWKTAIASGGSGLAVSDGSNVRLYNSGTASESSNLRAFA
jgi:hypothetical protein